MYWHLKKEIWEERDNIIFGEADLSQYFGGVRRFKQLTVEQIKQLRQQHLISSLGRQNNSPTAQEIWEFMEKYEGYVAMGYVVSPQREDCRVTLDGVEKRSPITNPQELADFQKLFSCADEIVINCTHVWYD